MTIIQKEPITGVNEALGFLNAARKRLSGDSLSAEILLPAPWIDLSNEISGKQIDAYARLVIPERMLYMKAFSLNKSYHFTDGYLVGSSLSNPSILYMMTRGQIELFALVYHTVNTIIANSGPSPTLTAVRKVNNALQTFLQGSSIQETDKSQDSSESIPQEVVASLKGLVNDPGFEHIGGEYRMTFSFLYPGWDEASPLQEQETLGNRLSVLKDINYLKTKALKRSAAVMANCVSATMDLFEELEWPFGRLEDI